MSEVFTCFSSSAASADAALIDGHVADRLGPGTQATPRRPTRL